MEFEGFILLDGGAGGMREECLLVPYHGSGSRVMDLFEALKIKLCWFETVLVLRILCLGGLGADDDVDALTGLCCAENNDDIDGHGKAA